MKIFNVFPTACRTEPEQVLKNKNDITDLKNDLTTAKNDLATLKAEVDNLKIDDDTLKQKISALETSINNIEASINGLDESVGNLQETSQNQALEIQENKENITQNTNNIDALDNRITAVEDTTAATELEIEGIRKGSIPVGEAENVNNLLANYLTTSSTQDEINNAISDFENKHIPMFFKDDDIIKGVKYYKKNDAIIFAEDMKNMYRDDNAYGYTAFESFIYKNNKWNYQQLPSSLPLSTYVANMEYLGLGTTLNLELHFTLYATWQANDNVPKPSFLINALDDYNPDFSQSLSSKFISGYCINSGGGCFPIINIKFDKSQGVLTINYIENNSYQTAQGIIDLSKLNDVGEGGIYPNN